MDDTTAQSPLTPNQPPTDPSPVNEPILSYVDNYAPPTPPAAPMTNVTPAAPTMPSAMPGMPSMPNLPSSPAPLPTAAPTPVVTPMPATPPAPAASEMAASPVTASPVTSNPAAPSPVAPTGQALEEQNIFDMLGAGEANDQEKEAFLDELQQVIWEDFLENDVELLITESEKAELKQIQDKTYPSDLEKQEAIVVFLEKLIPDLEDIMLEKALELKRDMFMERIAGMKDTYVGQTEKLNTLSTIENLVSQDKWGEAVKSLNQVA